MAFDRKEYKKVWDSKRGQHHRKLIQRWKGLKGCSSCGYKEHYAALQLDHVDPSTKDPLMKSKRGLNYKWSKDRIKKELSKCQVLCANCHSIKTFEEGDYLHEGNQKVFNEA